MNFREAAMTIEYAMVIEPPDDRDGGDYGAYFPDLPGCGTTGRTLSELRDNAKEAVEAHIGALKKTGQPIPDPKVIVESVFYEAS